MKFAKDFLKSLAMVVGAGVILLWLAGAVGLGQFHMHIGHSTITTECK